MEYDAKLVEKPVVVVEEVPNIVDARMEIGFHDQLDGSDMEIAKHLVMDNQVVFGDELHVVDHLVVSNEIVEDLHMDGDLHMVVEMDLNSYVATNVDFDVDGVDH